MSLQSSGDLSTSMAIILHKYCALTSQFLSDCRENTLTRAIILLRNWCYKIVATSGTISDAIDDDCIIFLAHTEPHVKVHIDCICFMKALLPKWDLV
jgi:hypothetical protein